MIPIPRVQSNVDYLSQEVFGKPNTWKSSYIYSIANYKDLIIDKKFKDKKTIIVFSNETSHAKTLKRLPKEVRGNFDIWQHSTLEEFEDDWIQAALEYKIYIGDDSDPKPNPDKKSFESQVKAIIIDEMYFLYASYIERYKGGMTRGARETFMRQKDYGTPRKWFIEKVGYIYKLPCHVLGSAKVTPEYAKEEYTTKEGDTYLQFVKTGGDNYRLPDMWEYYPATRLHLYFVSKDVYYAKEKDENDKNKLTTNPSKAIPDKSLPRTIGGTYPPLKVLKEDGKPMQHYEFFADILKNKVDPFRIHTIRNPTVKRVRSYLNKIGKRTIIDGDTVAKKKTKKTIKRERSKR